MDTSGKSFRRLLDQLLDRLDPKERSAMEAELARKGILEKLLAVAADLREETRAIGWETIRGPIHALIDQMLADVKAGRGAAGVQRGVTVFDSKLIPIPEGIRPAVVDTRRVRYQIGVTQLELCLYPVSPSSCELIGQLTGREPGGALQVELRRGRTKMSVAANEFSLFRFPRVPVGRYELRLVSGPSVIGSVGLEV
jgi:hypothetical protein